jgi:predicted ATPase
LAPEIADLKATVGKKFRHAVIGSDIDLGTISNLKYNLEVYPDGMSIDPNTGEITWIPEKDQIGKVEVTVMISDGLDSSNTTFEIEVTEQKELGAFTSFFNLSSIIILIIFFLIILYLIIIRRRKMRFPNLDDQRVIPTDDNLSDQTQQTLGPEDEDSTSNEIKNQISPIIDKSALSTPTTQQSNKPSLPLAHKPIQEKLVSTDIQLPDFHPSLVGRDNELSKLCSILNRVINGKGGTVLLFGETGIGKTRLVQEFKQLARDSGLQVLFCNCLAESQTPFYPFLEAFQSGGLASLFIEDPPKVEAILLLTNNGKTIKEVIRDEAELNLDNLSPILSLVGDFLRESFSIITGEKQEGAVNIIGYKNYRIIIESKKNSNIVIILTGKENEFLINDVKSLHHRVINKHGEAIEHLDSNLKAVLKKDIDDIEDQLKSIIVSGDYDGTTTHLDDPRIRRNLLFKNVSFGLAKKAQNIPILLCIEDLQWSDPSSLALFHYIARSAKDSKILILGTFRAEEVTAKDGKPHPFLETMQLMDIEGLYETLELNRFHEDLTTDFLKALLANFDFSEEFIHRFYKETDGNPLFMIELLKYLIEEQIIIKEDDMWKLYKELKEVKIPKKIYSVILKRLDRLDKENRLILDYASVIGEKFTSKGLSASLGFDRVKLLSNLRVLEQTHKLIYPENGNYRFDHSKIKEVLYNELPEDLQIKYHSIIARSIETLNKDNLELVTEDLAFHYYKCKNKDKALLYLLKAVDKAVADYSLDEAVLFYSRALELEKDRDKRNEILFGLKKVYNLKGNLRNIDT